MSEETRVNATIERDAVRAEYEATVGRIAYVLGLGDNVAELAVVEEEIERLHDEIDRLRDKARRFKGWRVRYQWRSQFSKTWSEDFVDGDRRRVYDHAEWVRTVDRYRNVRIVRVYRKAKP